jgi:Rhodopirellula transposase DDE domain
MHWNGAVLDSIDAVMEFARTMSWNSHHPAVELITTTYKTGVKLTKAAMQALEAQLMCLPGLEKWFVDIRPIAAIVSSG